MTIVKLVATGFFILLTTNFSFAADGVVNVKSAFDLPTTATRLEKVLRSKDMRIFSKIDHSEGATKAGLELPPTRLIVFGNPKVGTKLMQCQQSFAIDLPQKALIWQDASGQVWLSYNDPEYLAKRHGVKNCGPVLKKVKKALENFASAATKKSQ